VEPTRRTCKLQTGRPVQAIVTALRRDSDAIAYLGRNFERME
jgi:hypothetical protein